jgi:hypothetical protein
MRSGFFSAFFLAILVSAAAPPALAQRSHGRDTVQPLDRLLPEIRRQRPGDFYDAEGPTYGPDGDPHYHLKWMTPGGRVIWLDTDARNGRVLRASPGRGSFEPPGRAMRDMPPAYERSGRPQVRVPDEDGYRPRFGGGFESRRGYDRQGYDRHGPTRGGPRAGDFGRRGGGGGGGRRRH